MKVFPDKISIWVAFELVDSGKYIALPYVSQHHLIYWGSKEKKRERKEEFTLFFCLIICARTSLLILRPQTGIYTVSPSGSQALRLKWIIPSAFLGLQLVESILWDLASKIMWSQFVTTTSIISLSIMYIHLSITCTGEGNGNSFQYSCLENPMDRGVWQDTVHGSQESDMT